MGSNPFKRYPKNVIFHIGLVVSHTCKHNFAQFLLRKTAVVVNARLSRIYLLSLLFEIILISAFLYVFICLLHLHSFMSELCLANFLVDFWNPIKYDRWISVGQFLLAFLLLDNVHELFVLGLSRLSLVLVKHRLVFVTEIGLETAVSVRSLLVLTNVVMICEVFRRHIGDETLHVLTWQQMVTGLIWIVFGRVAHYGQLLGQYLVRVAFALVWTHLVSVLAKNVTLIRFKHLLVP